MVKLIQNSRYYSWNEKRSGKFSKCFFLGFELPCTFDFCKTVFNKCWHDCLKNITILIYLSRNGYICLFFPSCAAPFVEQLLS